ncbi:MAG: hypothetical protein J0L93_09625 [Deltaproteobacteria bacterium]|nr:hypothetical protein [Deltaproteobacteria bacterium]
MKVFFILTAAIATLASTQNLSAQSNRRNMERKDTRNYSQLDRIEYKLDMIDEMLQDNCQNQNNLDGLTITMTVDVEHLKQNLSYLSYPSADQIVNAVNRAKAQITADCKVITREGNIACEKAAISKISYPSDSDIGKISTACQTVRAVCAVR